MDSASTHPSTLTDIPTGAIPSLSFYSQLTLRMLGSSVVESGHLRRSPFPCLGLHVS